MHKNKIYRMYRLFPYIVIKTHNKTRYLYLGNKIEIKEKQHRVDRLKIKTNRAMDAERRRDENRYYEEKKKDRKV